MKKSKMNLATLQGLLSRNEMRSITAGSGSGSSCTMTYKGSDGKWYTETGKCATYGTTPALTFGSGGGWGIPYCKTASFPNPVQLSSNGGVSKCS